MINIITFSIIDLDIYISTTGLRDIYCHNCEHAKCVRKEEKAQACRVISAHMRIRGRTLIEINLDIYSRRSAGYVEHCTSINAPTRLQLHPGSDITSELIICNRSTAHVGVHLCFAFTCRGWIRRSTVWRMARGIICKSNNLLEFREIKLAQHLQEL